MNKKCKPFRGLFVAPGSDLYEALESKNEQKIKLSWNELQSREAAFCSKYGLDPNTYLGQGVKRENDPAS